MSESSDLDKSDHIHRDESGFETLKHAFSEALLAPEDQHFWN